MFSTDGITKKYMIDDLTCLNNCRRSEFRFEAFVSNYLRRSSETGNALFYVNKTIIYWNNNINEYMTPRTGISVSLVITRIFLFRPHLLLHGGMVSPNETVVNTYNHNFKILKNNCLKSRVQIRNCFHQHVQLALNYNS